MANNKPKVAQVTMVSDKDPYTQIIIYWVDVDDDGNPTGNELDQETQELLHSQDFRITLYIENDDYNYPPDSVLIEGGQFHVQPLNLDAPDGTLIEQVQCTAQRFWKYRKHLEDGSFETGNIIIAHDDPNAIRGAAVLYSNSQHINPASEQGQEYEAYLPINNENGGTHARFNYIEVHPGGE